MQWSLLPGPDGYFTGMDNEIYDIDVYGILPNHVKQEQFAFKVRIHLTCCGTPTVIQSIPALTLAYTYNIGSILDINLGSLSLFEADSACCTPPLATSDPTYTKTDAS